jgi:hypothetical protein
MSDADTITHLRVKVGATWLHAVAAGTEAEVRKRLEDADEVWKRPGVECCASRPIDAWQGPFPKAGGIRQWAVEED